MKTLLILFGCVEVLLIATLILFLALPEATWPYPTLLSLISVSFLLGIPLLIKKRK